MRALDVFVVVVSVGLFMAWLLILLLCDRIDRLERAGRCNMTLGEYEQTKEGQR